MSEWVVPAHYGQWIVRMGYLIPISILHAYLRGHIVLAACSVAGCTTTILYWSKPTRGFRRTLDLIVIQLSLWSHLNHAWKSNVWFDYLTLITCAAATYPVGHALQAKGYLDLAMSCHVILHIFVFIANNYLYLYS